MLPPTNLLVALLTGAVLSPGTAHELFPQSIPVLGLWVPNFRTFSRISLPPKFPFFSYLHTHRLLFISFGIYFSFSLLSSAPVLLLTPLWSHSPQGLSSLPLLPFSLGLTPIRPSFPACLTLKIAPAQIFSSPLNPTPLPPPALHTVTSRG